MEKNLVAKAQTCTTSYHGVKLLSTQDSLSPNSASVITGLPQLSAEWGLQDTMLFDLALLLCHDTQTTSLKRLYR